MARLHEAHGKEAETFVGPMPENGNARLRRRIRESGWRCKSVTP